MKRIFPLISLAFIIILFSCDSESIGEAASVSADDVIQVDSDLFRTLVAITEDEPESVTACIDFVYNFTVIVYDSNLEIVDFEIMHSDQEFIQFLIALQDENSISLSYPITSTLENGEQLIINNNEELQENLETCLEDETIRYCNALLEDCVWNVAHLEGGNNDFEDAYFEISPMGNIWFHYENELYLGTWISLYIEDELHLNINLINASEVGEAWNVDWKVTITDSEHMELISDDGTIFILEKECFSPCKQLVFEECEIELDSGIAQFNLDSYIECFLPFTVIEDITSYTFTFHETIDDALSGENPVDSENYTNIENPEEIFVRMIENDSGGILPILSIFLAAVLCS